MYAELVKRMYEPKAKERLFAMSKTEILAELPRLSHQERREIIERILDMEQEAQVLADCDRRADERFLLLDAMEAEDGQTPAGRGMDGGSRIGSEGPSMPHPQRPSC